jgi:hypothetical protein
VQQLAIKYIQHLLTKQSLQIAVSSLFLRETNSENFGLVFATAKMYGTRGRHSKICLQSQRDSFDAPNTLAPECGLKRRRYLTGVQYRLSSDLLITQPYSLPDLTGLSNSSYSRLLDQHEPLIVKPLSSRSSSPWFTSIIQYNKKANTVKANV